MALGNTECSTCPDSPQNRCRERDTDHGIAVAEYEDRTILVVLEKGSGRPAPDRAEAVAVSFEGYEYLVDLFCYLIVSLMPYVAESWRPSP
jgi:hypothetical protein